MRDRVLGAEEGALEIHIHHTIPGCLTHIGHAPIIVWHNPRVVIQHIHVTKGINSRIDHMLDLIFMSNIRLDKYSLSPGLPDSLSGLLTHISSNISNYNTCPLMRE